MQIREYLPGDESGFQALDREVELHPWNRRDLDNWRWKFSGQNPAGDPTMIYAEHQSKIVGHFAAIPIAYWIDGASIVGSHSVAMMISKEWQNKGLIKFLSDKLFSKLAEKNLPFTYGYPNDTAYQLHLKLLDYQLIGWQKLYRKKLTTNDQLVHPSPTFPYDWTRIEVFSKSVDYLWDSAKGGNSVAVERTAKFLNWRYLQRPDAHYFAFGAFDRGALLGYCILKLYKEGKQIRGHFVDIFTAHGNESCFRFMMTCGEQFLSGQGAQEVTMWLQGSTRFQAQLSELGFSGGGISGGGWPNDVRPMVCRFVRDKEKFQALLKQENWYFVMGDTLEIY